MGAHREGRCVMTFREEQINAIYQLNEFIHDHRFECGGDADDLSTVTISEERFDTFSDVTVTCKLCKKTRTDAVDDDAWADYRAWTDRLAENFREAACDRGEHTQHKSSSQQGMRRTNLRCVRSYGVVVPFIKEVILGRSKFGSVTLTISIIDPNREPIGHAALGRGSGSPHLPTRP